MNPVKTVHLVVSQEDINSGTPNSSVSCPVALGMKRIFPNTSLCVGHYNLTVFEGYERKLVAPLSEDIVNFIREFDSGNHVDPIEEDVNLYNYKGYWMSRRLRNFSVSEATLAAEGLIQNFASFIRVNWGVEKMEGIENLREALDQISSKGEVGALTQDEMDFVLGDLFNLLEELAPEGYYFGSHLGNGSSFGFWKIEGEDEDE